MRKAPTVVLLVVTGRFMASRIRCRYAVGLALGDVAAPVDLQDLGRDPLFELADREALFFLLILHETTPSEVSERAARHEQGAPSPQLVLTRRLMARGIDRHRWHAVGVAVGGVAATVH